MDKFLVFVKRGTDKHGKAKFEDSGEGPFDSYEDAAEYAHCEVGVPCFVQRVSMTADVADSYTTRLHSERR